jgi:hypothetical protein
MRKFRENRKKAENPQPSFSQLLTFIIMSYSTTIFLSAHNAPAHALPCGALA